MSLKREHAFKFKIDKLTHSKSECQKNVLICQKRLFKRLSVSLSPPNVNGRDEKLTRKLMRNLNCFNQKVNFINICKTNKLSISSKT